MSCFSPPPWVLALALAVSALAATPPRPATAPIPDAAHRRLERAAIAAAKKGNLDRAFLLATQAAQGQANNTPYLTVRELLRERATLAHLRRAHQLLLSLHPDQAAPEFRAALQIDPSNTDARAGLISSYPAASAPVVTPTQLRVRSAAAPVEIAPRPGVRDFHLRLNLRPAIAQVAAAYGLRAYVADQVPDRGIRLDIADADFAQAMRALRDVGGVGWIPIDPHTLYFAPSDKLAAIEPMALRTFYLPWVNGGVGLTEVSNTVKQLLGIKDASFDVATRAISLRATPTQLDAAEQLLLDMHHSAGDVLLEVKIVEVDATTALDLGIAPPDQFTMFALGPLLEQLQQSLAANAGEYQTILQLYQQGGLEAVLNSGLLGLGGSGITIPPALQNPFVTIGGGLTLLGISTPTVSANANWNSSHVSTAESVLLRATSGQDAEIKVGQRYPIITGSFAPTSVSPGVSSLIGSSGYEQPLPSFTWEDLGMDAKLTPTLSPDGGILLKVHVKVDALAGAAVNGIPILSNRDITNSISVRDGEPVMLAGLIDREQMEAINGLPGLSLIPGLGQLFSTTSPESTNDQLVLIVTPHVVKLPQAQSAAIWLPAGLAEPGDTTLAPVFTPSSPLIPGSNPGDRGPGANPVPGNFPGLRSPATPVTPTPVGGAGGGGGLQRP